MEDNGLQNIESLANEKKQKGRRETNAAPYVE